MSRPKLNRSSLSKRFVKYLKTTDPDKCWDLYIKPDPSNGYYRAHDENGKLIYLHRYSYELFIGPLPDDKNIVVDHLCNNKACVNPNHLEAVTQEENSRRGRLNMQYKIKKGIYQKRIYEKKKQETPEEYIKSRIKEENTCWVWQRAKTSYGYGTASFKGRIWRAHRLSYTIFKGSIQKELTLDHLCRNTSCVNPDHLEAVTIQENILRRNIANDHKLYCSKGHWLGNGDNFILYVKDPINYRIGKKCIQCVGKKLHRNIKSSLEKLEEKRKKDKELKRRLRKENPEKYRERCRNYIEKNREKINKSNRIKNNLNKEKVNAKNRESYKRLDKEKLRQRKIKWGNENRGNVRLSNKLSRIKTKIKSIISKLMGIVENN